MQSDLLSLLPKTEWTRRGFVSKTGDSSTYHSFVIVIVGTMLGRLADSWESAVELVEMTTLVGSRKQTSNRCSKQRACGDPAKRGAKTQTKSTASTKTKRVPRKPRWEWPAVLPLMERVGVVVVPPLTPLVTSSLAGISRPRTMPPGTILGLSSCCHPLVNEACLIRTITHTYNSHDPRPWASRFCRDSTASRR